MVNREPNESRGRMTNRAPREDPPNPSEEDTT
jgi:hypothetical protein